MCYYDDVVRALKGCHEALRNPAERLIFQAFCGKQGDEGMNAKRSLTYAALLAGLLFLNGGLVAAVQSDIVGYTTMTMEAGGWYIIGNAFAHLDDSLEATVDNLFADATFSEGDMLFLSRNDGAYMPRYWNSEKGKWSQNPKRFIEDKTLYPASTGVYIHKNHEGSVVFAGKVLAQSFDFGSEGGNSWTLTAVPSPEGKLLSDYEWKNCAQGDRLFVARGDGAYTPFYYFEGKGWSENSKRFIAPKVPLASGQAVYINKVSVGIGSVLTK